MMGNDDSYGAENDSTNETDPIQNDETDENYLSEAANNESGKAVGERTGCDATVGIKDNKSAGIEAYGKDESAAEDSRNDENEEENS